MPPVLCSQEEVGQDLFLCTDQSGAYWLLHQPVDPGTWSLLVGPIEALNQAWEMVGDVELAVSIVG